MAVKTIDQLAIASVKATYAGVIAVAKTVNAISLSAGTSYITSVQNVSVTIAASATSGTATITSVDTSLAVLFYGGNSTTDSTGTFDATEARVELTNATTVTAYRNTSSANTVTAKCTVVVFTSAAIQSIQAGVVTVPNSASSGTSTVSAVTVANSVLIWLGATMSGSTSNTGRRHARMTLTNTTTITANSGVGQAAGTSSSIGWMLVEFKSAVLQSIQQVQLSSAASSSAETITISSVTTGNTLLLWGGMTTSANVTEADILYWGTLTNGTTITLTRSGTGTGSTRTVNIVVLEFASGVLSGVQRGSIAVNSATSNTATITSADTSKSFAYRVGYSSNVGSPNQDTILPSIAQTDATTVTAAKGSNGATATTAGYEVPTFQ